MRLYTIDSTFDFGKNEGKSIKEVLEKSLSYTSWCFQKLEWFCITDEIFNLLPEIILLRKDKTHKDWLDKLERLHQNKKDRLANDAERSHQRDNYYKHESYEEYAGSYAQDVEGFSDEFINDVFCGEPDAYWNID